MLLFLHNSYGKSEFPDCGYPMGADCVQNLRWYHMEPYAPFMWVNTEPLVHWRKANAEPSLHFMKANRKHPYILGGTNTEFLTSVRMHLVKAYMMPHHNLTLQNCSTTTWH